jgi:hypothetical protein
MMWPRDSWRSFTGTPNPLMVVVLESEFDWARETGFDGTTIVVTMHL